jgi:hypothetical protein
MSERKLCCVQLGEMFVGPKADEGDYFKVKQLLGSLGYSVSPCLASSD